MHIPLWHFKKKVTYSDGFKDVIHHYCRFCELGLEFSRKGDAIVWLYPWCRKKNEANGKKFLCLTTFGVYNTLKEIDEFWEEYWKAGYTPETKVLPEIDNYLES